MKQQKLAAKIWLIGIILSIALVAGETIEIGPTKVFIDTENIGSYSIVKGDPYSSDHKKPDFQYGIYTASLDSNNSSNQVLIEVHQMSISNLLFTPISKEDVTTGLGHCIERSNLVSPGDDVQNEPYVIDGNEGLLVTVNKDQENPLYIVAYSPDRKNDSGNTVCIVGSDFPWDITKNIFESIETQVV